jgi:tetratricopeptide (TPR) repeat protein
LSSHFATLRPSLQGVSFQVVQQLLRSFSQKTYFPFYGGMVALLSQGGVNDLLTYLDAPLRQVPQTQEKARIMTLIGYSQQVIRNTEGAIGFHQEALTIAQSADDHLCAIANLNHLSRTYAMAKDYDEAISFAQQALITARQKGDALGQANALANVGYSEILRSRQFDRLDEDSAEIPISQLMQGLQLASGQDDRASQALCNNSLGIAHVMINQAAKALPYLVQGLQAAQESGDRYLQGMNLTYFSSAQALLGKSEEAMLYAILAMYTLEQIQASEWQQSRNDLLILRGRLGLEMFDTQIQSLRSQVIRAIGVDGYDHMLTLLV